MTDNGIRFHTKIKLLGWPLHHPNLHQAQTLFFFSFVQCLLTLLLFSISCTHNNSQQEPTADGFKWRAKRKKRVMTRCKIKTLMCHWYAVWSDQTGPSCLWVHRWGPHVHLLLAQCGCWACKLRLSFLILYEAVFVILMSQVVPTDLKQHAANTLTYCECITCVHYQYCFLVISIHPSIHFLQLSPCTGWGRGVEPIPVNVVFFLGFPGD